MGIILFLVDTSASMNQKTYLGASYLDVAKVAVETFLKYRAREPSSRLDKYMLVSFDEPPNCIKAGWKNNAGFITQLKNLRATSLSTFGQSLKESFDLLNVHRLHTSIDHYGQGRNPFFLEPAVVIALTDGGKLTNPQAVENEFNIPCPLSPPEGSELTDQAFRWDQRLFTVILRLPGLGEERNTNEMTVNSFVLGESTIAATCEMTGGKSYLVSNQKSLVQCMESLTQKLQPGVVINFRKIGGKDSPTQDPEPMEVDDDRLQNGNSNGPVGDDHKITPPPGGEGVSKSNTAWHSTRKMIFVKNKCGSGFWPIPESFWPDTHTVTLPPRMVHPVLWFDPTAMPPLLVEKFPFDKYELEPSPLTQWILGRRNANICWQVFVSNSGKQEGLTHSFGYLKASSSLTHVTLFVMPFNYRELLPLAEDLLSNRLRPPNQWRHKFNEYISTVPSYYAQPLRKAFEMMGAPSNIIPESFDSQMSYSITNYLRKLKKQAKLESERARGNASKTENSRRIEGVELGNGISLAIGSSLKDEETTSRSFHNPFDITRSGLLGQLARMRTNFLHSTPTTPNLIEEVVRHQVPIGQMGNYQDYLKKMNPLRELDEAGGLRTQLFGNPFKLERQADKTASGKLAESADMDIFADEHMVEMRKSNPSKVGGSRKRMRLRSPSPYPLRNSTPPPGSTPSSNSAATGLTNADGQAEKAKKVLSNDTSLPMTKDSENSTSEGGGSKMLSQQHAPDEPAAKDPHPSGPRLLEPFKSTSLPEEKTKGLSSSKNKVGPGTRKRERTPSPTSVPNPKRVSVDRPPTSKLSSALQMLRGGSNHVNKSPSPVPLLGGGGGAVSRLENSSASRVLTEELHKQQGQENTKLKALIAKEVRKMGKNYEAIFQHLEEVRGSADTKDTFVSDVIKEAGRFKRKKLIQELEEWRAGLRNCHLTNTTSSGSGGRNKGPPTLACPVSRR